MDTLVNYNQKMLCWISTRVNNTEMRNMYIYISIPGTCLSLILGFNPPKQGPFQQKQWSFGFQVYILLIYSILDWRYFCILCFSRRSKLDTSKSWGCHGVSLVFLVKSVCPRSKWKETNIGNTPIFHWTMMMGGRVTVPSEICVLFFCSSLTIPSK